MYSSKYTCVHAVKLTGCALRYLQWRADPPFAFLFIDHDNLRGETSWMWIDRHTSKLFVLHEIKWKNEKQVNNCQSLVNTVDVLLHTPPPGPCTSHSVPLLWPVC